ncbi:MAG: class I SAM-dependent methyltransferase [Gammaproteobacteria bacterium]
MTVETGSEAVKKKYDRIAPFFDLMETMTERIFFSRLRKICWRKVEGCILEVGVGTGKNFSHYPPDKRVTAIDFSVKMLEKAKAKAADSEINVDLRLMDIQNMNFPDNSFDTVVATFVFCSVPNPGRGLEEVLRVLKPGGKLLLLEHVLSGDRRKAAFMNFLNPLVFCLTGANINRTTLETVKACGFVSLSVDEKVGGDIIKMAEARKPG